MHTSSGSMQLGTANPAPGRGASRRVSLRGIEASDERAVAGAMNVASQVHGTVDYGGMMNSETVFLQVAAGEGSRYKILSVIIPIAVWRQIAGTARARVVQGQDHRGANHAASCRG
jgi:hypothetical protein